MFVELTKVDGEGRYPVIVNSERVMYVVPLDDGNCRLYMNVADNGGRPHELDVVIDYEDLRDVLKAKVL